MIQIAQPLLDNEEVEAVLRVLTTGQLAQGEYVSTFEQRFAELCHVREAVAVSSGTAALHLALLAHGIGPGDEVITTAFSFAATANVILLVGALPVFVDIEPDTYTIDPALVEAAITPRTKAIMPVHLYSNPSISSAFISCMLPQNNKESPEFTSMTYLSRQEIVQITPYEANRNAWYTRLVKLLEAKPEFIYSPYVWSLTPNIPGFSNTERIVIRSNRSRGSASRGYF